MLWIYRNISLYANLSDVLFFAVCKPQGMFLFFFFFTSAHVPIVLMLAVSIKGKLCIQVAGPRSGTREVIIEESSGDT